MTASFLIHSAQPMHFLLTASWWRFSAHDSSLYRAITTTKSSNKKGHSIFIRNLNVSQNHGQIALIDSHSPGVWINCTVSDIYDTLKIKLKYKKGQSNLTTHYSRNPRVRFVEVGCPSLSANTDKKRVTAFGFYKVNSCLGSR